MSAGRFIAGQGRKMSLLLTASAAKGGLGGVEKATKRHLRELLGSVYRWKLCRSPYWYLLCTSDAAAQAS